MAKSIFSGMLRAAANQVARDGGKALSNSIYGDAHSTPIRRVGGVSTMGGSTLLHNSEGEMVTTDELRQWCKENGMSLKISRTAVWQVVLMAIFGMVPIFVTGVVFGPAFIFASLRRIWYFFTADALYAKKAMVANKIPDRRYSCGYRIEGSRKGYEIIEVPPTLKERSCHLWIALVYMLVAIGIIGWNYFVYYCLDNMPAQ